MGDGVRRWHQTVALVAHIEAALAQELQAHHGIGLSEYRALMAITESSEGELRMQDLAEQLRLAQSSVTRLVARLETRGLAERDECVADGRGIFAVITPAGRKLAVDLASDYENALRQAMSETDARSELANAARFFAELTKGRNLR